MCHPVSFPKHQAPADEGWGLGFTPNKNKERKKFPFRVAQFQKEQVQF